MYYMLKPCLLRLLTRPNVACSPSRRKALRVPWHTTTLPEDAGWPHTVPTASSTKRTALPATDLHNVRGKFICMCYLVLTTVNCRQPESSIAPYLTDLQARTKNDGIRVGSYPLLSRGVYVSLIGRNVEAVKAIAQEVASTLDGRLVSEEEAREMVKEKEKGAA